MEKFLPPAHHVPATTKTQERRQKEAAAQRQSLSRKSSAFAGMLEMDAETKLAMEIKARFLRDVRNRFISTARAWRVAIDAHNHGRVNRVQFARALRLYMGGQRMDELWDAIVRSRKYDALRATQRDMEARGTVTRRLSLAAKSFEVHETKGSSLIYFRDLDGGANRLFTILRQAVRSFGDGDIDTGLERIRDKWGERYDRLAVTEICARLAVPVDLQGMKVDADRILSVAKLVDDTESGKRRTELFSLLDIRAGASSSICLDDVRWACSLVDPLERAATAKRNEEIAMRDPMNVAAAWGRTWKQGTHPFLNASETSKMASCLEDAAVAVRELRNNQDSLLHSTHSVHDLEVLVGLYEKNAMLLAGLEEEAEENDDNAVRLHAVLMRFAYHKAAERLMQYVAAAQPEPEARNRRA